MKSMNELKDEVEVKLHSLFKTLYSLSTKEYTIKINGLFEKELECTIQGYKIELIRTNDNLCKLLIEDEEVTLHPAWSIKLSSLMVTFEKMKEDEEERESFENTLAILDKVVKL